MATNELSDLQLNEVSIVDAGANEDANILLYKRGSFKTEFGRQFPMGDYAYVPDPTKPSKWKLRLTADPGAGPNARIVGAAVAALGPTGFRGRKVQIPTKDLPGVKAKVLAAWKKLHPDAKELPASLTKMDSAEEKAVFKLYMLGDKGGNDMSPEELEKRFEALEKSNTELTTANEALTKRADEAEAALKKSQDEHAELVDKAKKGENPFAAKPEDEEDDEMKKARAALPESVRKRMDDQDTEIQKQADEIAKMKEDSDRQSFVKKAEDTYGDLPGTSAEMGEALRGIHKAAPGSLEVIEKALAAGNAAIKKANEELGAGGEGGGNDALHALEKAAGDIAKRDGITKEAAFVKAKNENPELWTKHRAEAKAAH